MGLKPFQAVTKLFLFQFYFRMRDWLNAIKATIHFYRAMHSSAKRGIAIAYVVCLSVRLSVCL